MQIYLRKLLNNEKIVVQFTYHIKLEVKMLYINVPFSEKDEAKKLGAWWDSNKKSWFVKRRRDYPLFYKWILGNNEERFILCDHFYIVEGKRRCYRCHKETEVIGFAIEKFCIIYDPNEYKDLYSWWGEEIHMASYIKPISQKLLNYLDINYGYHIGYSKTVNDSYLANHCKHCSALQGDYFLFSEPDSPFCIDTIEDAKNIKLYKVKLDNDIVADVDMIWGSEDYLIKQYAKKMWDISM